MPAEGVLVRDRSAVRPVREPLDASAEASAQRGRCTCGSRCRGPGWRWTVWSSCRIACGPTGRPVPAHGRWGEPRPCGLAPTASIISTLTTASYSPPAGGSPATARGRGRRGRRHGSVPREWACSREFVRLVTRAPRRAAWMASFKRTEIVRRPGDRGQSELGRIHLAAVQTQDRGARRRDERDRASSEARAHCGTERHGPGAGPQRRKRHPTEGPRAAARCGAARRRSLERDGDRRRPAQGAPPPASAQRRPAGGVHRLQPGGLRAPGPGRRGVSAVALGGVPVRRARGDERRPAARGRQRRRPARPNRPRRNRAARPA